MKSKILGKRVQKTKVLIHNSRERIQRLKKRLVDAARNYKVAVEKERVAAVEKRRI